MRLMQEVQRIQGLANIEPVDFSGFLVPSATPSDTFNMTLMILAELQPIKAFLGMKHTITVPGRLYDEKKAADVQQLLEWARRKLQLIQTLSY
jgi:hypothetical protein